MVAAEADVIEQILKVKSQMDSGMFKPLQLAAVEALKQGPEWFAQLNEEYSRRRVLAGEIFDILGVEYDHNSSGMFLWGRVPEGKGEALADNPQETADLMDIVRRIRDEYNMTILLIEHDMKFVSGLCDEVTVLNFGTVLAQGSPKDALNDPEVIRAYIGG